MVWCAGRAVAGFRHLVIEITTFDLFLTLKVSLDDFAACGGKIVKLFRYILRPPGTNAIHTDAVSYAVYRATWFIKSLKE